MNLKLKIALRYVISKKSLNFISIISAISIIGIAIGVAALIAVLSIFRGLREFSENQLLAFDPHIRMISANSAGIKNYKSIEEKLKKINEISVFSSVKSIKIVASKENNLQPATMVSYLNYSYLQTLANNVCQIDTISSWINIDTNQLFVGLPFAERLNLYLGDSLTVISSKMLERAIQSFKIPNGIDLTIAGFFQANVKDYDLSVIYANPVIFNKIPHFNRDEVSYIDIKLINNKNLDYVKGKLMKIFSPNIQILTWVDLNKDLYYVMQFERVAVFSILSLILLIAVFNVFASLAMAVTESKQDIAIFKSMGAENIFIRKIYLIQGVIIGIIGTLLGLLIGLFFSWGQNTFKWFTLGNNEFIIDAIPVSVSYIEVTLLCLFSIGLSIIATLYPAKKAANISIINSLIHE